MRVGLHKMIVAVSRARLFFPSSHTSHCLCWSLCSDCRYEQDPAKAERKRERLLELMRNQVRDAGGPAEDEEEDSNVSEDTKRLRKKEKKRKGKKERRRQKAEEKKEMEESEDDENDEERKGKMIVDIVDPLQNRTKAVALKGAERRISDAEKKVVRRKMFEREANNTHER